MRFCSLCLTTQQPRHDSLMNWRAIIPCSGGQRVERDLSAIVVDSNIDLISVVHLILNMSASDGASHALLKPDTLCSGDSSDRWVGVTATYYDEMLTLIEGNVLICLLLLELGQILSVYTFPGSGYGAPGRISLKPALQAIRKSRHLCLPSVLHTRKQ